MTPMIVSHEHKFIFLKTIKTAGTSIEAALVQVCGPDDIITPYREASEKDRQGRGPQNYRLQHPLVPKPPLWRRVTGRPERYYHPTVGFFEHMPAWRARVYLGEQIWRSYFKFAFERNPWDRQISWYFYKTKTKLLKPNFDRFMNSRKHAYVWNFEIYGDKSEIAVDYVGRYERLEEDLSSVLKHIGVNETIDVPHTNRTRTRDHATSYQTFYTPRTQELVAEWYAREINALGYTFEGMVGPGGLEPPTRRL
jgi:hypothetical protein